MHAKNIFIFLKESSKGLRVWASGVFPRWGICTHDKCKEKRGVKNWIEGDYWLPFWNIRNIKLLYKFDK